MTNKEAEKWLAGKPNTGTKVRTQSGVFCWDDFWIGGGISLAVTFFIGLSLVFVITNFAPHKDFGELVISVQAIPVATVVDVLLHFGVMLWFMKKRPGISIGVATAFLPSGVVIFLLWLLPNLIR